MSTTKSTTTSKPTGKPEAAVDTEARREMIKAGAKSLETALAEVGTDLETADGMMKTIAMAEGIMRLSEAITDDVMSVIMKLQGLPVGFKTDQDDKQGYPVSIVKQVFIQASLLGATMHGNEVTIIKGGCYLSQNFFMRKLKEHPGVTDLEVKLNAPEDPILKGDTVEYRVTGWAQCKLNGQLLRVVCENSKAAGDSRVVVSAYNNSRAVDGCLGKAKKRIAQQLYERITGSTITDDDGDDGGPPATITVVDPEAQRQKKLQEAAGMESQDDPPPPDALAILREKFRGKSPECLRFSGLVTTAGNMGVLDYVVKDFTTARETNVISVIEHDLLVQLSNLHARRLLDADHVG